MAAVKRREKCRIARCIVGASLLVVPNGVAWYWGNVSILALSYVIGNLDNSSGVQTPWVISLYIIFRALGLIAYEWVKKKIGQFWVVIAGIAISDAGLLLCYFAVQQSLALVNVSLGIVVGFGTGLLFGHSLRAVLDLTDKYVGVVTSVIQGSFAAGAMLINEFVTVYANPDNYSPDLKIGFSSYFSQKAVLDRVPFVFLFMGGFSVVVHVISFILLLQNMMDIPDSGVRKEEEKQCLEEISSLPNSNSILKHGQETKTTTNNDSVPFSRRNVAKVVNYSTTMDSSTKPAGSATRTTNNNITVEDSLSSNHNSCKETPSTVENTISMKDIADVDDPAKDQVVAEEKKRKDYSPREMLKTLTFYVLWFAFFVGDFPILLMINYYKSFGQIYIQDDHFLTIVGTTTVLCNTWIRVFWGMIIDILGPKNSLIAILVPLVLVNSWFYLAAIGGKWTYIFLTFIFGALSGALYSIFPAIMFSVFGKKHFSTNFGMLTTASIIFNLMIPPVMECLLSYFGWLVTFSTSALLNAISIALCLNFVH